MGLQTALALSLGLFRLVCYLLFSGLLAFFLGGGYVCVVCCFFDGWWLFVIDLLMLG